MRLDSQKFISPFSIYVVWHPEFIEGKLYAENIFSTFCRELKSPLARAINIPVYFRSKPKSNNNIPIEINYEESHKNAIIILVDDKMVNDDHWRNYIQELVKNLPKNTRVFPIAFSDYSYYIDQAGLSKIQFIRANEINGVTNSDIFDNKWKLIKSRLLHDVARQLKNEKEVYNTKKTDDAPVKLFLSHAKKDGEDLAKKFRDFLESYTKLDTFFDTNDIADGHDFEEQIKTNINNSAIIVFNTDEFSNREWCRREVIIAKRFGCPILCVHSIKKGETRSFPYLGNVPTLIWEDNIEEIINDTLIQVIQISYNKELLDYCKKMYEIDTKNYCIILPKAPELFNYIDIEKYKFENVKETKDLIVLYPEPPLGIEEINLLNDVDSKIKFLTPVQLPSYI
jgi:hypothetical protein